MDVLRCVVLLAAAVGTGACGEVKNPEVDAPLPSDGGAGDAMVPGDATPIDASSIDAITIDAASDDDFAVTIAATARVINGQPISIDVRLDRGAQHTAAVEVSVDGLPAGVTAAPLTIAGTASTGQLALSTEAGATHGFHDLTILAVGGGKAHDASLRLAVTDLPGKFDRSLAGTGLILTDVTTTGLDQGFGVATQADGKIVVAEVHNGTSIGAARYLADGTLDDSFGTRGRVTTAFGTPLASLTLQPDNKLLLVSSSGGKGTVIRLNVNGTLDTSFGNATGFINEGTTGEQVIVQPDGKLVFFATANASGVRTAQVVRVNSDGSPDMQFGTQGRIVLSPPLPPPPGTQNAEARGLFLNPDNTIVLAGMVDRGGTRSVFLARLTAGGTPDISFGAAGYVNLFDNLPGRDPASVRRGADGKFVVAGTTTTAPAQMFAIRITDGGSLDSNYGVAGVRNVAFGGAATLADLALAADGSAILVGRALVGAGSTMATARLSPSGAIESTWAANATAIPMQTDAFANAVTIDPDGRVLVTGAFLTSSTVLAGGVVLTRLWP